MKMVIDELTNLINDAIEVNKKVSNAKIATERTRKVVALIVYVNAQERFTKDINGVDYSKFSIPAVLKDLVYPDSLSLTGDNREEDYLVRPQVPSEGIATYREAMEYCEALYSVFKIQNPIVVTIDSLKVPGVLSAEGMAKRLSYDGNMVTDEEVFPIPCSFRAFKSTKYLFDEGEVLADALKAAFRAIR